MRISLIVAASENNVIGKDSALPWDLPNDLRRFREITNGHHIIMGRKTYESIGQSLPNRQNVVISHNPKFKASGADVVSSLTEALALAKERGEKEAFVIGGGQIFAEALPLADRIYITRIHAMVEGDAFFPALDPAQWEEVEKEEHEPDVRHLQAYTFLIYERRR